VSLTGVEKVDFFSLGKKTRLFYLGRWKSDRFWAEWLAKKTVENSRAKKNVYFIINIY
jgi:hypothetical protein